MFDSFLEKIDNHTQLLIRFQKPFYIFIFGLILSLILLNIVISLYEPLEISRSVSLNNHFANLRHYLFLFIPILPFIFCTWIAFILHIKKYREIYL